ncbi:acetylglutamate kinase [Parvularcula maris]|uniref:acetylglutamate kinase n=1 Tax=Parvularcula maris TaxID=2965077 RepID=A0A9X2L7M7_9PROT|nr:acetylglutamate kinase [Parvularcula maris]MCQ8184468.1 acetylglutamate kinase [Parvularcula maris]
MASRETSFRDRVSLLLGGLEEGREVRAYLRRFEEKNSGCFAVVKVGGAVLEQGLDDLADALALLQFLGLPPVVVYGSGPQLDRSLAAAGIREERCDGMRITPEEAVPLVAEAASHAGLKLAEALRERGAHAVTPQSALRARLLDRDRYGLVGEPVSADKLGIEQLLRAGVIPLIGCVHADERGQLLNVNADNVARCMVLSLRPRKVVFVTGTGGLLDGEGSLIDSINLAEEGDELFAQPWLSGGMRHKVQEIASLLSELEPSASVSVTGPAAMVRELFTHSGAGTLIRQGERIERRGPEAAKELEPLLEEAFGRKLKRSYWTDFAPDYVLASERGRAGAVIGSIAGVPLLDKFAVSESARGEGLAKSLWQRLHDAAPELVWRSRRENPFNGFYSAQADGFVRRGPWSVYWTGSGLEARIEALADELGSRPPDFEGDVG